MIAELVDSVERHDFSFRMHESLSDKLFALAVRNEGSKPLKNVKVGFRWHSPHQTYTVVPADGPPKDVPGAGVIDLGNLPPQAEVKVFGWGITIPNGANDITLSHEDGIGTINVAQVIPAIWYQGGVFVSYRQMTYWLIAILLLYIGLEGVTKYISDRRRRQGHGAEKMRGETSQ